MQKSVMMLMMAIIKLRIYANLDMQCIGRTTNTQIIQSDISILDQAVMQRDELPGIKLKSWMQLLRAGGCFTVGVVQEMNKSENLRRL